MTLSVVIPCRHQAHFLKGLLEELRHELGESAEIIVVDDASKYDDPRSQIPDPTVRLVRSPLRLGVSAARNLGAQLASGKYVYFIDADDRIVPGTLQKAFNLLESSPGERGLSGVLGGFIDCKGSRIFPTNLEKLTEAPKVTHLTYDYFQSGGRLFPNIARFIFERTLFLELRGFSPELDRAEDWDFILRWTKVFPILLVPFPMYYHRVHQANGTVRLRGGEIQAHRKSLASGKLVRMGHGLDVTSENL